MSAAHALAFGRSKKGATAAHAARRCPMTTSALFRIDDSSPVASDAWNASQAGEDELTSGLPTAAISSSISISPAALSPAGRLIPGHTPGSAGSGIAPGAGCGQTVTPVVAGGVAAGVDVPPGIDAV